MSLPSLANLLAGGGPVGGIAPVTPSGTLTSTALVTGAGGSAVQTPSATTTLVPPVLNLAGAASGPAAIRFGEDSDNGSNYVAVIAPAALAGNQTMTLPDATDTFVGKATTDTLTNKRFTPRVATVTSSATPTINTDSVDIFTITALATAITSFTTNLSGTPTTGQALIIRILDDGTARAITWGASFASRGATLPTTTTLGKYHYVSFLWNEVASKWDCVAALVEA